MMNELTIHTEADRMYLIDIVRNLDLSRPLTFIWKLYRHKRSLTANALLHVWLGQMLNHPLILATGATEDQLKDQMKKRFLGYETVIYVDFRTQKRVEKNRLRRTRDLDSGEFCAFLQNVQAWALWNLQMILKSSKEDEFSQWMDCQNG